MVSDAEVLHESILPALGVSEDRIGYHHTLTPRPSGPHIKTGCPPSCFTPPTSVRCYAWAQAGLIMPRKSDLVRAEAPDGPADAQLRRRGLITDSARRCAA